MGLRGPPKRPTALTLIAGNPGKRSLPKHEPKPPVSCPDPPDYLSEVAQAEWRRVCPRLADLGLMSDIDIAVLAGYCGCFADLIDATQKQAGRATVLKTHNGNWVTSPFVTMIRQARIDMVRFAAQLGMTPASRAGMDIQIGNPDTAPQGHDPTSRFFGS